MTKVKGSNWLEPPPLKMPSPCLHPSAVLSKCSQSFTCSAKVAQFIGSRHFQICLLMPSSSCVYLPATTCLALVVRSYILSNSINWHVWSEWVLLPPILPFWMLRIQVSGPREYHQLRVHYFLEVRNWSSSLARASNMGCWYHCSKLVRVGKPLVARHWTRSFVSCLIIINYY